MIIQNYSYNPIKTNYFAEKNVQGLHLKSYVEASDFLSLQEENLFLQNQLSNIQSDFMYFQSNCKNQQIEKYRVLEGMIKSDFIIYLNTRKNSPRLSKMLETKILKNVKQCLVYIKNDLFNNLILSDVFGEVFELIFCLNFFIQGSENDTYIELEQLNMNLNLNYNLQNLESNINLLISKVYNSQKNQELLFS